MSKEENNNIDDLFSKDRLEKEFNPSDSDWLEIKDLVLSNEVMESLDSIFSKDNLEQEFKATEMDWEDAKEGLFSSDQANVDELFTRERLRRNFIASDSDWLDAKDGLEGVQNVDLLFTKSRMELDFNPAEEDWNEIKDRIVPKKKRRWPIVLILLIGLLGISALVYNRLSNIQSDASINLSSQSWLLSRKASTRSPSSSAKPANV